MTRVLEGFRVEFAEWVANALPEEWRDISRGTEEERAVEIRRRWGEMLFEAGWAAPSWPPEYGGRGLSDGADLIVMQELVAAGAPEALNSNGIHIFGNILLRYGTEEQKERYLRPMLDHTELWCQGFSEPDAGSDLASLRTRAIDSGDHFIVRGQKVWTSYAQYAHRCYLLVRTSVTDLKHTGISLMILDMQQKGITVRPLTTITGSAEFNEVFLDDVVIPSSDLVGAQGDGWKIATEALTLERAFSFAERSLRLERELANVIALVSRRDETNGAGLDPCVTERILDSYIDTTLMRSLIKRIIAERHGDLGILPSIAKLHWSESHQRLLGVAFDALGTDVDAIDNEEWVKAYMFTRGEAIYAGTSEIQRNLIAKALGLPTSKTA
jgi:alkylation response protein AidB-like acyl-CoA dehydrogenase